MHESRPFLTQKEQVESLSVPYRDLPVLTLRPGSSSDWLQALERRKQLARGGQGWEPAVKMAAVVEVEVGGGAVAERELDEVRRIEGQEGRGIWKVEGEEVKNGSRRP